MSGAPTTSTVKANVIFAVCWRCRRMGAITKRGAICKYGANKTMPDLLAEFAGKNCPNGDTPYNWLHNPCRARLYFHLETQI